MDLIHLHWDEKLSAQAIKVRRLSPIWAVSIRLSKIWHRPKCPWPKFLGQKCYFGQNFMAKVNLVQMWISLVLGLICSLEPNYFDVSKHFLNWLKAYLRNVLRHQSNAFDSGTYWLFKAYLTKCFETSK